MMNSSSWAPDPQIDYFKGSRCGFENCKSKRYYIEEGFTYCQDGHQQDIGPQTHVDDDDFYAQLGAKTRQKKDAEEKTNKKLHHGRASTELHLHCYQLILWKQCYALIHTIGLPPELESVIKDLWALRLQLLKGRLSDPEKDGEQLFTSKPEMKKSEVGKIKIGANTDIEAEDEEEKINRERESIKDRGSDMPTLIESLGICYLAMILLRLPISVGDLQRWAIKDRIPFIRATRFIPRVMTSRLPLESMRALETAHPVLSPDYLFRSVQQLCLFYSHNFNICFPTPNIPLLLFKHVKSLALPPEISQAVQSLSTILSIPFSFPLPSSKRIATSSFPEIKLLALIIIAVKIYHPFDSLPRHPRSDADLGTLAIDWEAWCDAFAKHDARYTSEGQLGRGNEMNVREKDVMNKLTTSQLDEYLDWAERTLVDPEPPRTGGLPKQLLDMFPTGRLDGSSAKELSFEEETRTDQVSCESMLETCMKSLKMRTICPEDEEGEGERRRLGSFYKRYRKAEDLTPSARKFHEAIASLLNISLNTLLPAVLQVERKLQVFVESELKERESQSEDVKGEHGDDDDDDDDDDDGMDRVGEGIVESSPPHIKREGAGSKRHGNGEGEKQSKMQIEEEGEKETSGTRAGDDDDDEDCDDDDDDDDGDADDDDDNDQTTSKSPIVKSFRVKKESYCDTDDDDKVEFGLQ